MGGLKPIGSEKLEGMDKIRRIMEIATFRENIPNPINETKSTEYSANLADGHTYFIVKERLGYIIKKGLNESTSDYIDTIQSRKYYPSYSQALKRLNLMSKEFNTLYGNDEGMSLFTEQKKKFKLKLPGKKTTDTPPAETGGGSELPPPVASNTGEGSALPPPPAGLNVSGEVPPPPAGFGSEAGAETPPAGMRSDTPPPIPGEEGGMETPPAEMGSDTLPPIPGEEGDEEMGDEETPMPDDEGDEDKKSKKDEPTSFKVIQKLTGKLAQKIRKYNAEDDMDPNDVKYILNSVLSALDVDLLDEDDIEEIISRLEGDFDEDEDEDEDTEDEDTDMPEEGSEESPEEPMGGGEEEPPTPPEGGEMSEYNMGDAINKSISQRYVGSMKDKLAEKPTFGGEMDEEYPKHGARTSRHQYNHLSHGTFGESKVDKILSKYFTTTKSEIISEERKRLKLLEEIETKKERNFKSAMKLSETVKQKRAAFEYLEKNPTSKLLGKTKKGSLVFSEGVVKTKITTNGLVI